jgi:uncharacterized membrane protein
MQNQMRNTFLTGIFAVVPISVTIYIVWKIESITEGMTEYLFNRPGRPIPLIGIIIALAVIYATGMLISSIIGQWFIRLFDRALSKVPGLNTLYQSWKQIALTPGGTEGTFSKVVLIPSEVGGMQLGFTSGRTIEGHENTWCVFIPNAPNPITGRLHFLNKSQCTLLDCSAEEAFKVVISTGNYVPSVVGLAIPKEAVLRQLGEGN